jgi:D-alanyl-D-alanine carboxypeptidase
MAIFVTGAGTPQPYGAAAGDADATAHRPLTIDTPLRVASNTKTFTAAAILRLWELGKLDLDSSIDRLISPRLNELLRADGFATDRITVRQLLSHSAGLYDPGSDPRYIKSVLADPKHVWTREEQVRLLTEYADPQSAPGTEFRYSDSDYVLLGDIIERITGEKLGRSVRTLLRLDRLGLRSTWWEFDEAPPTGVAPRARQFLGTIDATGIHGSMDLYGGGGLIMSTRDLATFAAALFEGRIFDRPETLQEMLWKGPHRDAGTYRLGIFVKEEGNQQLYWHSGFWGTLVYYNPRTRVAVAGMTTNQKGFADMRAIVEGIARGDQPAKQPAKVD